MTPSNGTPNRPARSQAPDKLLCLDIETIPDADLVPEDWPADKFPKSIWHKVACISFVEARIEVCPKTGLETYLVESVRSGGEPDWDERRLVRAFWKYFESGRYRVVSWNGRAFDLPVLQLRALTYGIPIPAWFLRGDKWEGYSRRYSVDWHADLMEMISNFGASPRMGLDDVATAMGLPGKAGEHGSNVADMVRAGNVAGVRDYCETDCVNTAGVYFRWALVSGKSDTAGHDRSIRSLVDYLEAERSTRPHLGAFLDRWRASTRPVPMTLSRSVPPVGTGAAR